MDVRLALVVPEQNRQPFEECLRGIQGVRAHWALYSEEAEIASLLEGVATQTDAILFAGPMALDRSVTAVPADVPVTVVRLSSVDLALGMLRARELGCPIAPASIDTFNAALVREVCGELELPEGQFLVLPYQSDTPLEKIVEFHRQAAREHGAAYAITGRSMVYSALVEQGEIPVIKAIAVHASIRAAMNEAVLRGTSRRHAGLRFGAALFKVLERSDLQGEQRNLLSLQQLLLGMPELEDAWIEPRGDRALIMFAHRGLMETVTAGWTTVPAMGRIEQELDLHVAVGFGLGDSARSSVTHAERALVRAEQDGGGCGYLLGQDGLIIGPIDASREALRFTYKTEDGPLRQVAERSGLGITTVSRLADIERRMLSPTTTSAELSAALHVSEPSGRRILRALREAGLATPAGVEQPIKRGRPKQLYRLRVTELLDTSEPRTEGTP